VHAVQADESDGCVVIAPGIYPHEMRFPLCHHFQQSRRDDLLSVPKVQPLAVLVASQPAGYELEYFRSVERQELHVSTRRAVLETRGASFQRAAYAASSLGAS